jgi:hypothetical protein
VNFQYIAVHLCKVHAAVYGRFPIVSISQQTFNSYLDHKHYYIVRLFHLDLPINENVPLDNVHFSVVALLISQLFHDVQFLFQVTLIGTSCLHPCPACSEMLFTVILFAAEAEES